MSVIVASRPDGLGTRLLAILYARRLSELLDVPMQADWPSMEDVHYQNDRLLQSEQKSDLFANGKLFRDIDVPWAVRAFHEGKSATWVSHHDPEKIWTLDELKALVREHDILLYNVAMPLRIQGYNPRVEAKEIRRLWQQLSFTLDVRKACAEIIDQVDMEKCVAVHVRRGDILNILTMAPLDYLRSNGITQIFQRYIPFQTAVDAISRQFADATSVLVCSEDATIGKRLQGALKGKRVISSVGKFPEGSDKAAMLDILLLSRSHNILAPYHSTFSECAARVGRYAKIHKAHLDVANIVAELMPILEKSGLPDVGRRKAVLYAMACQNLWGKNDADLRAKFLGEAMKLDPEIAKSIAGA